MIKEVTMKRTVYQWVKTENIPTIYQGNMDQVKAALPDFDYRLIPVKHGFDINVVEEARNESDLVRFNQLIQDPWGIWIDWDTRVVNPFDPPEDGKMYCSTSANPNILNGDVIYANGNTTVIPQILSLYKIGDRAGWILKVLNSEQIKNQIAPIPPEYFQHFGLCHTAKMREGDLFGNAECSVRKINGQLKFEWIKEHTK